MKRLSPFLVVAILLVSAVSFGAVTFTLSNTTKYSDRDGNVYTADSNGKISVPSKYATDAINAGLVPDASLVSGDASHLTNVPAASVATFENTTSNAGICSKGAVKFGPTRLFVCFTSHKAPGWKKAVLTP